MQSSVTLLTHISVCVCVYLTSSWHWISTGEENILYLKATTADNKYVEKDNKVYYTTMKEASINKEELNLPQRWGKVMEGNLFLKAEYTWCRSRVSLMTLRFRGKIQVLGPV